MPCRSERTQLLQDGTDIDEAPWQALAALTAAHVGTCCHMLQTRSTLSTMQGATSHDLSLSPMVDDKHENADQSATQARQSLPSRQTASAYAGMLPHKRNILIAAQRPAERLSTRTGCVWGPAKLTV